MIQKSETLIVIPAYNAENTIKLVLDDVLSQGYTNIVVCDDKSTDNTVNFIKQHYNNVTVIIHSDNLGYGANQKSLYNYALSTSCSYVIMVHGDGQYNPALCSAMNEMLKTKIYDVVIGSRIITSGAIKNGMPIYKYFFNRTLTLLQNLVTSSKLSEYHTGYRAYKLNVLKDIDFNSFSNDFIFDNQMLMRIIKKKHNIGEISCPTIYKKESSSISFKRSIKYGIGVVKQTILFHFTK